ncbi:MAG: hypothetical protein GX375_05480 [Clostridiales bacterium]|nr:hypothetical protein [Clostridiales bacterium]
MSIGEKGSAIIVVLLVLLVLSLLGITLLNMDIVHMKILSSDKLYQAAYYYAEAGLTQQIENLCNNMEQLYKDPKVVSRQSFLMRLLQTPINPPKFEDYEGKEVKVNITCKRNNSVLNKDEIVIISTCRIGNINRSVKASVHVVWRDPNEEDFKLDHSSFYISEWIETR